MRTEQIHIRSASREDMPEVLRLIKELATYEKASDQVKIDAEQLMRDIEHRPPRFECLLAEIQGLIVGMALHYPRYSTWKGPTCYLEDLIVAPSYRRKGIGRALMMKLEELTKARGLARLEWQVLDWNTEAIRFYESLGARSDSQWLNMKFEY